MTRCHLAQVNIALMRGGLDEPVMSGLAARIDEMNRLAEHSPGFVWRSGGPFTAEDLDPLRACIDPFEAARLFYNLSVWETVDDLRRYVFNTAHAQMLRGRDRWIDGSTTSHLALWWIPLGHIPTIAESAARLHLLQERGATREAFTFARTFPPDVVFGPGGRAS